MSAKAIAAAGFDFYIKGAGAYTLIQGITQFTPGWETQEDDTSDFDGGGNDAHLVTGRGKSWKIEGNHKEDPATGTRDVGQALVEQLADEVGEDAYCQLKIISPGGNTKEYYGTVRMDTGGGGTTTKTNWGFEFKRSGADVA
jgi:hypothetical protein